MSFMDDIKKKAADLMAGSQGEHPGIVQALMGMVTNRESGGVAGLVQSFREKGLGDIVSSWIGHGKNEPITPDQVQEGMGQERVQQFAEKAGISHEEAKSKLAKLLPEVVDKLTPEGKVPEEEMTTARK